MIAKLHYKKNYIALEILITTFGITSRICTTLHLVQSRLSNNYCTGLQSMKLIIVSILKDTQWYQVHSFVSLPPICDMSAFKNVSIEIIFRHPAETTSATVSVDGAVAFNHDCLSYKPNMTSNRSNVEQQRMFSTKTDHPYDDCPLLLCHSTCLSTMLCLFIVSAHAYAL
jgi:hypothetical protein